MAGPAAVILAGVAAVGALTSAGMSFGQAAAQRRAAKEAQDKSDAMLREAKKRLEVNFFEGLNVPLDAYEKQREMSILGTQTAIQALQEGDPRNLAAGVGRVGQVASAADEKMRIGLADDLYKNRTMKAESKADINDQLINLSLGQGKQQSQMAQSSKEAANAAVIAGISSIGEAAATGIDALPLFGKGKTNKQISDIAKSLKENDLYKNYSEADISSILRNKATKEQISAYSDDATKIDFLKGLFPEIY